MKLSEIITIIIAVGVLVAVFFSSRGEQKHDKEPLFDSNGTLNQDFSVPSFSNLSSNTSFLASQKELNSKKQTGISLPQVLKKGTLQRIKGAAPFTLGIYSIPNILNGISSEECLIGYSPEENDFFDTLDPSDIQLDDVVISQGEAFLFVQGGEPTTTSCAQILEIPQFSQTFKGLHIFFN